MPSLDSPNGVTRPQVEFGVGKKGPGIWKLAGPGFLATRSSCVWMRVAQLEMPRCIRAIPLLRLGLLWLRPTGPGRYAPGCNLQKAGNCPDLWVSAKIVQDEGPRPTAQLAPLGHGEPTGDQAHQIGRISAFSGSSICGFSQSTSSACTRRSNGRGRL